MDTLALTGIYTITAPSGRQYVGSALHFRNRWKLHKTQLHNRNHHCPPLQAAFDKYGWDALRFEVVELTTREAMIEREQFHMDARGVRNLYNCCPTAGSCMGVKLSSAHKAKIGAAHRGKKLTPEHIAKLKSVPRPPLTSAQKAKISAAHRGRTHSAEAIAKRRAARSSSAYPFVVLDKARGLYLARPRYNGGYRNLGRFTTAEQAHEAVKAFIAGGY